ncbi:sulfite exporter TauE/SafE family protein [Tumebacillus sp. ITR2]|uniref:Sulfite exporter TauE/SafE family protein n=1 Tax=Tumebacillus amylolyticus TaxID=2801339 RepID=A0ABS1JBR4_9BACL|nr:sulfite exporter TauE/SafE family protein [Tumebacillus amylolyticus]MBL0387689.1 sulfite exporter TauE/SafE family protein [Tumebacillus amylolyticus]
MDLLVSIPAAIGLGALHFLEPGHGKGVLTAYLVSSRARPRDAVLLGVTNALAHTVSILFLALVATTALQYLLPQQIEAWLGLLSGAVITLIGGRMVLQMLFPPVVTLGRLNERERTYVCSHGHVHVVDRAGRDHSHGHHHHPHDELPMFDSTATSTKPRQENSVRRLFTVGVLTGLIPCPTSLVMLLTAVSAGQVSLGIGMVLAFSFGGALSLSLLGLLLLKAESKARLLERRGISNLMAQVSSLVIVVLGILVTYESLFKLGLFQD